MGVNLLAGLAPRHRQGTSAPTAALGWLLIVTLLAAAAGHLWVARLTLRLREREAERLAAQARAAPAIRLRREIARLEIRVAAAERLRGAGPRMEATLAELAQRLPAASWLTELEVVEDSRNGANGAYGANGANGGLRLSGRAPSFSVVAGVLGALDAMPQEGRPMLLEAQRPRGGGALRFQIQMQRPLVQQTPRPPPPQTQTP